MLADAFDARQDIPKTCVHCHAAGNVRCRRQESALPSSEYRGDHPQHVPNPPRWAPMCHALAMSFDADNQDCGLFAKHGDAQRRDALEEMAIAVSDKLADPLIGRCGQGP